MARTNQPGQKSASKAETSKAPQEQETIDPSEQLFRWKKSEGGSFHWNHKIIKPGQIFIAREKDIPQAFRDQIIKLDDIPIQEQTKKVEGVKPAFEMQEVEGLAEDVKERWNIITKKGKILNDAPYTKEKAEQFLNELMQ